jgi:hypothetical protein
MKAAMVERFHRTLWLLINRYQQLNNTYRFIDVLPDLVANYNSKVHRTIGMAPKDVTAANQDALYQKLVQKTVDMPVRRPKFKVGDMVRIQKARGRFDKETVGYWTPELFRIIRVLTTKPVTYKLEDRMNEEIHGTFYDLDLKKGVLPDKFKIDSIVGRRTVGPRGNRRREVLVHWRGYPKKFDSWINEDEVGDIVPVAAAIAGHGLDDHENNNNIFSEKMVIRNKLKHEATKRKLLQIASGLDGSEEYEDGEGFFSDLVNKILPTRMDFPPKVREMIKNNSDKIITGITVGRTPVNSMVTRLLNSLSKGQLEEQEKMMNYSDLYHLFMLVTLSDGSTLLTEKNSVVNIEKVSASYPAQTKMPVNLQGRRITFGDFINNTVKAVGSSIYLYDAVTNNCQYFVMNCLNSNGLLTPDLKTFIMQDIQQVLSTSPDYVAKIASFATDTAAKLNRLVQGAGEDEEDFDI